MTAAERVTQSFLYVADKRPVLVFEDENDAEEFQKKIPEGETFANHKRHVFLATPHGLESVRGGQDGKTAYVFHQSHQAKDWLEKLSGYGVMYSEGEAPTRTVFLGSNGHMYGGLPIFPGVA